MFCFVLLLLLFWFGLVSVIVITMTINTFTFVIDQCFKREKELNFKKVPHEKVITIDVTRWLRVLALTHLIVGEVNGGIADILAKRMKKSYKTNRSWLLGVCVWVKDQRIHGNGSQIFCPVELVCVNTINNFWADVLGFVFIVVGAKAISGVANIRDCWWAPELTMALATVCLKCEFQ